MHGACPQVSADRKVKTRGASKQLKLQAGFCERTSGALDPRFMSPAMASCCSASGVPIKKERYKWIGMAKKKPQELRGWERNVVGPSTASPTSWCSQTMSLSTAKAPSTLTQGRGSRPPYATYSAGSICGGMGLISVPNSCSILYRLKRSSYVTKLMARPRCPKRPERPMRCK